MADCASGRKHTPLTSQQQRKLFYVWQAHPDRRPASITASEVDSHLKEAEHKTLPRYAHRRKRNG